MDHRPPAAFAVLSALLLAALALACIGCAGHAAPHATTTVIITRHAEKDPGPTDPGLSTAGRGRAAALADLLRPYRITTTLATRTRRAMETAAPTIAAFNIPPERTLTVPPATTADALAATLRARPEGESILVVSHSNIIPALLRALGAPGPESIAEDEFGRVFVLRLTGGAVQEHSELTASR